MSLRRTEAIEKIDFERMIRDLNNLLTDPEFKSKTFKDNGTALQDNLNQLQGLHRERDTRLARGEKWESMHNIEREISNMIRTIRNYVNNLNNMLFKKKVRVVLRDILNAEIILEREQRELAARSAA